MRPLLMRPLLSLLHTPRLPYITLLDASAVVDALSEPSSVADALSGGVKDVADALSGGVEDVAEALSGGVEDVADALSGGVEEVGAEVEAMFSTTANWNFVLVAIALALASTFETLTDVLERSVPKRLLPVVQKSVAELASLGFVGLVIEAVSESGASWLRSISTFYLGEPDFLLEQFEAVHEGLFGVTIIYFAACALLVLRVTAQFREWGDERTEAYVSFKLAEYEWRQQQLPEPYPLRGFSQLATKMVIDGRPWASQVGLGLGDELAASYDARVAEFLRFRERFIDQSRRGGVFLPAQFNFNEYLEEHASKKLRSLVAIEPQALTFHGWHVVGVWLACGWHAVGV